MFIDLNMMINFFIFIFRRPIIIGWGRDTRRILWPIRNSIWICGWRLDCQVDPIKIGFTGSPTLWPTTCGRLVVLQPSEAPNQYRAPNLRSLWPCSNTQLSPPKSTTTYQRRTHNSKNNKYQSLNNKEQPTNSFAKWSWTWHKVEHVRLIHLFCRMTASLLYINF